MKWFFSLFFLLPVAEANELKTFQSDGCTMFVEGPLGKPKLWAHCCFEHDLRYWFGGTLQNQSHSDLELRSCVKKVAGKAWADLIYKGVRSGHGSPIKSKYQWSWGWTNKRGLAELSPEEKSYVIHEIKKLPLKDSFFEEFVNKYLL